MYKSTIIFRDFNFPLSVTDYTNRLNISKDIEDLNNTINQLNLIDIYRMIHLKTAEYPLFSSTHRVFPKMDHMLSHKVSLNKCQRIKIIQRKILKEEKTTDDYLRNRETKFLDKSNPTI